MSLFSGPKEIILSIKEEPLDMVGETEHILNRKLFFLCRENFIL